MVFVYTYAPYVFITSVTCYTVAMRKEIEVKARVADMQAVVRKLEAMGIALSEPVVQDDETFVDAAYGAYDTFQPGKNILRIRATKGGHLFTLKQPQSNELDCIEHETAIEDAAQFRQALLCMGYQPVVHIHKERRKGHYQDYEICLDTVRDLGSFIEVEQIIDDATHSAEAIQSHLFAFLEQLGITKADQETHGYDTLIYLQSKKKK